MAIRQTKYIDITSGVGGASAVRGREFIGRVFTTNDLCGFGHVYEFNDADPVVSYFGGNSAEANFALKYFGFVSKSVTKAKKLSFMKWADGSVEGYSGSAYVLGMKNPEETVSLYQDTNAKLILAVDDERYEYDVDLSDDSGDSDDFAPQSLQQICNAVANALTQSATHPIQGAEVSITSDSKIKVSLGSGSPIFGKQVKGFIPAELGVASYDLSELLGIDAPHSVCSNVAPAAGETPVEAATRSDRISDNYGSFVFLDGVPETDATYANLLSVIAWNKAKNYKYLFVATSRGYTDADGNLAVSDALSMGTATLGTAPDSCVWAYRNETDAVASLPMSLFATTDFLRANSTKTFMYQQNALIPAAITSDAGANALDAVNVNYIGSTQSAGSAISFTQDGVSCDGTEIGVVCNEIWLKSSFFTAILNAFLSLEKIPANEDGIGIIKTVMMDTITTAIRNGTIQPRKELTVTQKVYIGQVTGDTEAWKTVYDNGYWLDVVIEDIDNKKVAKYVLVYSKGDAVRKVEGSDILI